MVLACFLCDGRMGTGGCPEAPLPQPLGSAQGLQVMTAMCWPCNEKSRGSCYGESPWAGPVLRLDTLSLILRRCLGPTWVAEFCSPSLFLGTISERLASPRPERRAFGRCVRGASLACLAPAHPAACTSCQFPCLICS